MQKTIYRVAASLAVFVATLGILIYFEVYIAMSCEDYLSSLPAPAHCVLYDPSPSALWNFVELVVVFGVPAVLGFVVWRKTKRTAKPQVK